MRTNKNGTVVLTDAEWRGAVCLHTDIYWWNGMLLKFNHNLSDGANFEFVRILMHRPTKPYDRYLQGVV